MEPAVVTRRLGSLVLLVVLVGVVAWNLPASALRARLLGPLHPVVELLGLEQNWSVFAPNPRRLTLGLYALIEHADGSVERWELPTHREPLLSPYRTYRWQKWMEHARADDTSQLWAPTARWLARTHDDPDNPVVRVRLIRRWYDTPPPGTPDQPPPPSEYEYFVLDLEGGP